MNDGSAVRQLVIRPVSVSGSATAYVIDTAGFNYAEFEFDFGVGPAGTAVSALYLNESDVKASATSLTNGTQVPGTVFGTSYTSALPSNNPCAAGGTANTATGVYPETAQYPLSALPASNNSVAVINVDLKGRKRYLLAVVTTGTTTLVSASCRLTRDDVAAHVPAQMVPASGGSGAAGNVLWCPPVYPTSGGL